VGVDARRRSRAGVYEGVSWCRDVGVRQLSGSGAGIGVGQVRWVVDAVAVAALRRAPGTPSQRWACFSGEAAVDGVDGLAR